jgi:hypothetical protein
MDVCSNQVVNLLHFTDSLFHNDSESRRLADRCLTFNVNELLKAATNSVNWPMSDIKIFCKISEGGFNRVCDILMKDGSSVLARLPYLLTSLRRLAVANKVTTLAFVRAHSISITQVLGYSTGENTVGAKYILMEKLPRKPIGNACFVSQEERLKVLPQIVKLEAKLFAFHFPAIGSIYYARDLRLDTPKVNIPGYGGELCVGPYAALRWWVGERKDLGIDRGPPKSCI